MKAQLARLAAAVKVKRLRGGDERPLPAYETPGAAGMDLTAALDEPLELLPGQRALVPTGIAIALPGPHLVALIFARSGLASRHGISLANGVGVVDSDYRGEIKVALQNSGREPFVVRDGDRVAQLVVVPVVAVTWEETDELPPSERGEGGFGSTGVGR